MPYSALRLNRTALDGARANPIQAESPFRVEAISELGHLLRKSNHSFKTKRYNYHPTASVASGLPETNTLHNHALWTYFRNRCSRNDLAIPYPSRWGVARRNLLELFGWRLTGQRDLGGTKRCRNAIESRFPGFAVQRPSSGLASSTARNRARETNTPVAMIAAQSCNTLFWFPVCVQGGHSVSSSYARRAVANCTCESQFPKPPRIS
jgi:hypothetical protein